MSAEIFEFPERRTCFRCVHFDAHWSGSMPYCQLFDKEIVSAGHTGRDCSSFEPEVPRGEGQ